MWSPILGGLSVPPKMAKMFDDAYAAGARIHSNSWGGGRNLGAYDAFAQQADDYMWKHPDFLLVFAAGNSGVDLDKDGRIDSGSVSSPGTAKNVLTVGASENTVNKGGIQSQIKELKSSATAWSVDPILTDYLSDDENGMACFSSRGPTTDGRIKPEIAAPGTNILSVFSRVPGAEKLWGEYNKDYVFSGGTSMATPLTSGAVAIVKQYLEKNFKVTAPSAALLKAYVMNTAFDMYPGQFGELGAAKGQELLKTRPNADEGFGRVDMDKATRLNSSNLIVIDEKAGLALGEEKIYDLNLAKDAKFVLNLVYTDAPGSPQAAKALVNNINVQIMQEGHVVTELSDDTNNFEFFEGKLAAGSYKVKVIGQNIPQGLNGKQAYALVMSHE
jgi:serine protease AprX